MNHVSPTQVHLSPQHADLLQQAARAAYPNECCGLLLGEGEHDVVVTAVVPAANVAENPKAAFAIDPQAQFNLLRAARGGQQRVVGHYHSHPDGPAQPSPRDLAMAHDPEAVWIVMGASAEDASTPRAFRRPEGAASFVEVAVTIESTSP